MIWILCLPSLLMAEPIRLWSGLAPQEDIESEDKVIQKSDGLRRISEVTVPTIEVFHAEKAKATGAAILVCPGGGYNFLSIDHEGIELCRWLSKNGITGVLLKYRVPRRKGRGKHAAPLEDAQRAIAMIRKNANQWGIDSDHIGVMGFSAGGHLASALLGGAKRGFEERAEYQKFSTKPNFGILIYPAYIRSHKDSQKLAPELSFSKECPPVFITVAKSDKSFYPDSVLLSDTLKKLGTPMKFHAFDSGGHGFGMGTVKGGGEVKAWPRMCLKWMQDKGITSNQRSGY